VLLGDPFGLPRGDMDGDCCAAVYCWYIHANTAPRDSLLSLEKSIRMREVPVVSSCSAFWTAASPSTRKHMYNGAPDNFLNISLTLARIAFSLVSSMERIAANLAATTSSFVCIGRAV